MNTTHPMPHRVGGVLLTLMHPDGTPLAHQEVTVAQLRHKFMFGCIGFDIIPLANDELDDEAAAQAQMLNDHMLHLFNFITLPFYWANFERVQGRPDTERLLATARWFSQRGCVVKGHPLAWHTLAPDWLLAMSTEDILQTQIKRIQREVTQFAGLIDTWDVLNEVVIMPIFDRYDNGLTRVAKKLKRIGIIRTLFEAAREANPRATLLLNDFEVSESYEILIEGCLEAGIQIDAIGIQSHMHQGYWGVEKTQEVLARFAHFGLPLHFTESTLVSGELMPAHIVDLNDYQVEAWPSTPQGEARQAEEVVQHYNTLMAHPAVEAITWWGLPDGGWLKAPSGLVRADYSVKPAYEALANLIKGEWWLEPRTVVTDEGGQFQMQGFLGDYEVTWRDQRATFSLDQPQPRSIVMEF